jgi:hypothetical protein
MPSATGQNWEKYNKTFADDEVEEKKITPLTDECVADALLAALTVPGLSALQGHSGAEDVRGSTVCRGAEETREGDQG